MSISPLLSNGKISFEQIIKQLKTTDIAKHLDIAESLVRKYAQVLEKQGYQFRKDPTQERIYTSIDELALNMNLQIENEILKVKLDTMLETQQKKV
ncbi:hypothetical protein [Peribacillus frigoritolerans]|uniref:hypothetical protein n=1 Tax=Peribacillus frigoritolerans TaxID=450367 RepID=UPI001070843E|nr:hypothetical protein [Peribacillus frigoritolerans]TFH61558.1 hypothetical protein E4J71_08905 [Peribacillus frigoritolerans]